MAINLRNYDPALMAGANIESSVDLSEILDYNGNPILQFDGVPAAVNYLAITNSIDSVQTANFISSEGSSSAANIALVAKGTGQVLLASGSKSNPVFALTTTSGASDVNFLSLITAATTADVELLVASNSDTAVSGLLLKAKDGQAATVAGGQVRLQAGAGNTTGNGGSASLLAGASGAGATGNGGDARVTAGASASTNGNGGNVILSGGVKTGSGTAGSTISRSAYWIKNQGAATAKTVSATLTAAEVLAGIITVNQGGGATSALQLPAASAMDTALPAAIAGDSFDLSVINISVVDAEDASVTTNTGWTLVGSMDFLAYSAPGLRSSGVLRLAKTGTGAWTAFRIS